MSVMKKNNVIKSNDGDYMYLVVKGNLFENINFS